VHGSSEAEFEVGFSTAEPVEDHVSFASLDDVSSELGTVHLPFVVLEGVPEHGLLGVFQDQVAVVLDDEFVRGSASVSAVGLPDQGILRVDQFDIAFVGEDHRKRTGSLGLLVGSPDVDGLEFVSSR